MDILQSTASYESWLSGHCELFTPDLVYKHLRMSHSADPFPFFRGTYYHWLSRWSELDPSVREAPTVLAIGDAHIENFGTWRDTDGRLVWGVNDFDETDELPYTNDLLRLAVSVWLAVRGGAFEVKFGKACRSILKGYRKTLAAGGSPFVLEENHPELRAIAVSKERDPGRFWKGLTELLEDEPTQPNREVRELLNHSLPSGEYSREYRIRPKVGVGSLGKPRYVVFASWAGGWVAREAKCITPPATAWFKQSGIPSRIAHMLSKAVRCPDPHFLPHEHWIIRRLAPRCSRIELDHLSSAADWICLLEAMGSEIANCHLGSPVAIPSIVAHLEAQPPEWLETTARMAAKQLRNDWKTWRQNQE